MKGADVYQRVLLPAVQHYRPGRQGYGRHVENEDQDRHDHRSCWQPKQLTLDCHGERNRLGPGVAGAR